MKAVLSPEIVDVIEAVQYRPAVSIIMPFEPKMSAKSELAHALKIAVDKVENEVTRAYPDELAQLVIRKLLAIINTLNFNTHKKSIAIYVSPVFEKVLYLEIQVEEKIIIDNTFEIRDLVYSKKQLHKYIVLVLSGRDCRMYLGNTNTFIRIVSNTPESIFAYSNDIHERVANFSDISMRKEVMMDKFLHHFDNTLSIVLEAYHLPLFVLGAKKMMGHFKSMTRNEKKVISYIHGNYTESSEEELKSALEPHIADWQKVMQKDVLNQLEEAASHKKLAIGMRDVWRDAMNHKGRLLVVEKNYMYAAQQGSSGDNIYKAIEPYNRFSNIKDAVDDVMEKVLTNGGDVEFVDADVLKDYQHIALVTFY
jgi:hypothetical protein